MSSLTSDVTEVWKADSALEGSSCTKSILSAGTCTRHFKSYIPPLGESTRSQSNYTVKTRQKCNFWCFHHTYRPLSTSPCEQRSPVTSVCSPSHRGRCVQSRTEKLRRERKITSGLALYRQLNNARTTKAQSGLETCACTSRCTTVSQLTEIFFYSTCKYLSYPSCYKLQRWK